MNDAVVVFEPGLAAFELAPEHPFKPLRSELVLSLLRHAGLLEDAAVLPPAPLAEADLLAVHETAYVDTVRTLSRGAAHPEAWARGLGTADNPVFPGMHDAWLGVCAATATAVELVAAGTVRRAFSPAGGLHHAHAGRASGFCVYNDLAVAMRRAVDRHGLRIAYIDIDAHHGDGVQELFFESADVLTISVHESGRYLFPGTGHTYELGREAGRGLSVNAPLEPFTEDGSFLEVLGEVLPPALERFRPDLILLQAGADMHRHDPLADLSLTLTGMNAAYRYVVGLADEHCGGRLVATGGGGYDAWRTVPRAWALLWAAMTGHELPAELPAAWREEWAARGIGDLPGMALDAPEDFEPQPRRRLVEGQNRAMLRRLRGALANTHTRGESSSAGAPSG